MLFQRPPRLPLIAPSILSADFSRLGDECRAVLEAGADLLHVDVMDGHFVPNLTMGPAVVSSLRASLPGVFLDVHVMVNDPGQYVRAFAEAGANHLTFHIEPSLDVRAGAGMSPLSQGYDPVRLAGEVRSAGMSAGIAINPGTAAESIFGVLDAFDLILVMSVNPGFSGQSFIADVLEKVRRIRPRLRADQRLQMDGGLSERTAGAAREAGCDTLVAASAIFGKTRESWSGVIRSLRGG